MLGPEPQVWADMLEIGLVVLHLHVNPLSIFRGGSLVQLSTFACEPVSLLVAQGLPTINPCKSGVSL